ncbi:hypothetical protein ACIGBL_05565 [Streptomyces sp. NPDC085614]|uniref:hypothetical protein n=1 Tax=Streptomyces sp. NPDC085614 TaxID=3365733 RepID=UPI0037CF92C3
MRATLDRWDTLSLDLRAGVDTGYPVGMPFLPAGTLQTLEAKILAAVEAIPIPPTAIDEVNKDLRVLQAACRDRLDPVA